MMNQRQLVRCDANSVLRRRGHGNHGQRSDNSLLAARPLQIVSVNPNHTLELEEEELRKILLCEEVKDRKVMVLSITGAFRTGKSFLLNMLLRYLSHKYEDLGDNNNWMGDEDECLTGFSWRGGCDKETTGITMWSKPFIATLETGEKIAILLMDTQGEFDHSTVFKETTNIFSFSTFVSSVQVYNVQSRIQERDLQHLQYVTEYSKIPLEIDPNVKPYQSLCFLVRDWCNKKEFPFGLVHGNKYLNTKVLQQINCQEEELRFVRSQLALSFDKLFCYLMPHPGMEIAEGESDGKIADMTSTFKQQLKDLAPLLLSPENLSIKKHGHMLLKGKSLFKYFQKYASDFKSATLPEPMTVFATTSALKSELAQGDAYRMYCQIMDEFCREYHPTDILEAKHSKVMEDSLEFYCDRCSVVDHNISQLYKDGLITKIKAKYAKIEQQNVIMKPQISQVSKVAKVVALAGMLSGTVGGVALSSSLGIGVVPGIVIGIVAGCSGSVLGLSAGAIVLAYNYFSTVQGGFSSTKK